MLPYFDRKVIDEPHLIQSLGKLASLGDILTGEGAGEVGDTRHAHVLVLQVCHALPLDCPEAGQLVPALCKLPHNAQQVLALLGLQQVETSIDCQQQGGGQFPSVHS
jgi:hypothetical protein